MNFAKRLFCKKTESSDSDDEVETNTVSVQTDGKRLREPERQTPKKVMKSADFEDLPTDYELSQDVDLGIQNACALCKGGALDSDIIGPFSRVGAHREVFVHDICARWTPDLLNYCGKESLYPAPRKFNVYLFKALHRASSLRCALCKQKGATIGCLEQSCRHSYHLPCAIKDKATFLHVHNAMHKTKVHSLLCGAYCRDCIPFQTLRRSTPKKPLLLTKMVRKNEIGSDSLEEIYRTWHIIKKIIGERNGKHGTELEIQFFGVPNSSWMKTDQLPSNLVSEYCKSRSEASDSSESSESSSDGMEGEVCVICSKGSSPKKNPIVYCDGKRCQVAVHKKCYNISKIPKDEWFCNRCSAKAPVDIKCAVCGSMGGAMTCESGIWQHINCSGKRSKTHSSANQNDKKKNMARLTTRDRYDIWEIILQEENQAKCPICKINTIKKESSFQCAHIDAKAKGCGSTANEEVWNIVPSCAKCNLTCNTKNLIDFMAASQSMKPQIKPLLFLKVKNIILCKMESCPLNTKEILSTGNLAEVIKAIYNPQRMNSIARLLELTSSERHNLFVNYEEQAPEHFYRKFSN
jgi:hypothetical protein